MKKVFALLVLGLFIIGYSAPTFADTTPTQQKVQKNDSSASYRLPTEKE